MRWRVYPIREFDRLTSQWNALNAAAGDLPFLRSEFLVPALREFGTGSEMLVTFGTGDGNYSAMGIAKARASGDVGDVPALAVAARRFPAPQAERPSKAFSRA